MNPRRIEENDYIEFLLAAQNAFRCVEASKSQPERLQSVAHDVYTRLLTRRPLDPEALWDEAQTVGGPAGGSSLFEGGMLSWTIAPWTNPTPKPSNWCRAIGNGFKQCYGIERFASAKRHRAENHLLSQHQF
jgi:hypothetical protein